MTNHPITPPPELLQEWCQQERNCNNGLDALKDLATQAAQWGADQELEACVEWIAGQDWTWTKAQLREARRPKQPSLKEQALEALELVQKRTTDPNIIEPIRRALETLPE